MEAATSREQRGLDDEVLQDLRDAFKMFDKSESGRISVYSADTAFRLAGISFTDEDNTHFLKTMGLEKQVSFTQLQSYAENYGFHRANESTHLQDDSQMLREAFYVLSKDNDGKFVSPYQLKVAMSGFGVDLTDEELDDMVKEADFDHDGRVNYKDFVRIMKSLD